MISLHFEFDSKDGLKLQHILDDINVTQLQSKSRTIYSQRRNNPRCCACSQEFDNLWSVQKILQHHTHINTFMLFGILKKSFTIFQMFICYCISKRLQYFFFQPLNPNLCLLLDQAWSVLPISHMLLLCQAIKDMVCKNKGSRQFS